MGIRRGSLWSAVVIVFVMTTVYLLYEPPSGSTQPLTPINVSEQVTSGECSPCHLRVAGSQRPGLIFDHGIHLVVACASCHEGMPHHNGGSRLPTMKSCFNCHRIQHGPQGKLARGDCPACHTPTFKLVPADHIAGFAGKPHAVLSRKSGINDCLMCHDPAKYCDACHVRLRVQVNGKSIGAMPAAYVPVVPVKAQAPTFTIDPAAPVTMGQCVYCHPSLDAFPKGKLIFPHTKHLERDIKCTVCHTSFPHKAETVERPSMQTCYPCHGLVHAAQGLVATDSCGACHPKAFPLEPGNHTPAFVTGGHKTRASNDQAYCAMCHKIDFCVACHQGRKRLPTGALSGRIVPKSHKKAEWRVQHGVLFLQQKGACAACHDSTSCTTCHYTPMPHPTDWVQTHSKVTKAIATNQRDCNVCHVDRERCQACHHSKVTDKFLISTSCIKCHPEMGQIPSTQIKDKGFAEHAVHFFDRTPPTIKRQPLRCDDCHVGFGTGSNADQAGGQINGAGHDTRLCYSCHGHLDYQNTLIAPWPGAELCLKCHKDLNIY